MPRTRRVVLRAAVAAGTFAIVAYEVRLALPEASRARTSLTSGAPVLLIVGLLLEVASVASYSALTKVLMPHRYRLSYPTLLAIDLTGLGVSHVMPGGGASASALRGRLWTKKGVEADDAASTTATQYAVNVTWLAVALLAGLAFAASRSSRVPLLQVVLLVALALVVVLGAAAVLLVVRPQVLKAATTKVAERVPFLPSDLLERVIDSLTDQVQVVLRRPDRRRRLLLWGLVNWVSDAASLSFCVLAFAHSVNLDGLLVTYAVVSLLALLPFTPGGLGLVEGVAIPALTTFGVSSGAALLGVLAWRVAEFWLPIPAGLGTWAWISLKER